MKAVAQRFMASGLSAERMSLRLDFQVRRSTVDSSMSKRSPGERSDNPGAALREDPHVACAHAGYDGFSAN
jgi:hypothetical protein